MHFSLMKRQSGFKRIAKNCQWFITLHAHGVFAFALKTCKIHVRDNCYKKLHAENVDLSKE